MNALDFVQIDTEQPEAELKRLEALHAQLSLQAPAVKRRLVSEFLDIVANPRERIWPRVQACNVLGALWRRLEFPQPEVATWRIREVIQQEFLRPQRMRLPFKKPKLILRETDPLQFCLFQALVVTLLRLDPRRMRPVAAELAAAVGDPGRKATLLKLLSDEEVKLSRTPGNQDAAHTEA